MLPGYAGSDPRRRAQLALRRDAEGTRSNRPLQRVPVAGGRSDEPPRTFGPVNHVVVEVVVRAGALDRREGFRIAIGGEEADGPHEREEGVAGVHLLAG